jgi:hypothetical protein
VDPARIEGALHGLAAHFNPAGGGIGGQDGSLGAADQAQRHAGITGGGMRRDVLVPLDEANLIAGPHLRGDGARGRGQEE